jgi:hypothetical protein
MPGSLDSSKLIYLDLGRIHEAALAWVDVSRERYEATKVSRVI